MNETTRKLMHSRKSDDWETPFGLYKLLDSHFHFTLDPCASDINHKCDKYYTIETDGLAQSWANEVVFCNPPYSMLKQWVTKAHNEVEKSCVSVLLIPARPDTKNYQDIIFPNASTVCFMRGRVKFIDREKISWDVNEVQPKINPAPFPSALIVFSNKSSDEVKKDIDFLSQFGYTF